MDFHTQTGSLTKACLRITVLASAIALASCGGGGSSSSVGNAGSTPVNPGGGTGGGTATVIDSVKISQIGIYDANGVALSSVGAVGANLKVKVTTNAGAAVRGAKVDFSSNASGEIIFGNTSGAVLTDENGFAQLAFKPSSTQISGAYILTAKASYKTLSADDDLNIQVAPTNVKLTDLVFGSALLSSGGQTSVNLKTQDSISSAALNGVIVNLSADCGQVLPASYNSANGGEVAVTYKSVTTDGKLCSGPVNITAQTNSGSSTQSKTAAITVEAPKVTSIIYPDGQSAAIGVQGSGSSSQASVKFVLYSNSTPLVGKDVTFSLVKSPLGLTIGELGKTTWTVKTDENGEAPVNIYPGSTPGPVEIRAEVTENPDIFALSKNISVQSSRASQNGLSLSLSANNIEGWDFDGTKADITMRVADKFGNAVPDGTVINFTAEGGQIGSSCTTVKLDGISQCKVVFESQAFRPTDGRVTILAVVEGEKHYIDNNKNNAFDAGDTLTANIGDTFRDNDENGVYNADAGDFIYPLQTGSTGACGSSLSVASQPNMPNTCNEGLSAPLRAQTIMLLAGSDPDIQVLSVSNGRMLMRLNSFGPIDSAGQSILPMPGETTVKIIASTCGAQLFSGPETIPKVVNTGFIAANGGVVPNLGTIYQIDVSKCTSGQHFFVETQTPKTLKIKTPVEMP